MQFIYKINSHVCPAKTWRMILRTESKLYPEIIERLRSHEFDEKPFSFKASKYNFQRIPQGGEYNEQHSNHGELHIEKIKRREH